jgi:hypothetical protein
MSLRFFHIVFITLSTLLSFGFAVWLYENYRAQASAAELLGAIISGALGVGLIAYGVWFFKKSRKIIL